MAYPATLTLKNLKTVPAHETNLWNHGLAAAESGESLHPTAVLEDCTPALNTPDYAGTITIPIYGNSNQYITLKPNEDLIVTVNSDAESLFYLGMNKPGVLAVVEDDTVDE